MARGHEDVDEAVRQFEARYQTFEKVVPGQGLEQEVVGEGAYGVVYKARCMATGRFVALKKIKLDSEDEGVPSTSLREVSLLKQLSHPNVVELLDVCLSFRSMVLAFEFVESDLKNYIKSCGRHLEPHVIKVLSFQLCRGVEYIHANKVLHRDLKPSNLLVDSELRLKIADFGLARAYALPTPKYTHEVVTRWYRPVEILLGSSIYSVSVDIWGVGCIFAEMATGIPLFYGESEIETIFQIFQKLGTPTVEQWPGLAELPDFKPTFPKWAPRGWDNIRDTQAQVGADGIDLLENLMVYDPSKRISARRALQHRYFFDATVPEAVV